MERLEPYEGKLSRTVLRGAWTGNRPRLPGGYLRKAYGRRTEVKRRYYMGIGVYGWRAGCRNPISHGMCLGCAPAYCAEQGLGEEGTARVLATGHGATSWRKRNPAIRWISWFARLESRRGSTIIAQGNAAEAAALGCA